MFIELSPHSHINNADCNIFYIRSFPTPKNITSINFLAIQNLLEATLSCKIKTKIQVDIS